MTSVDFTVSPLAEAASTRSAGAAVSRQLAQCVTYHSVDIDGIKVFYREAGALASPTVLLLHGYPTASHMFRNLTPKLAKKYHVIAPDLPGFGMTVVPADKEFVYSFDQLARIIDAFTQVCNLDRYAMYVFDYGAPVGWRLAMAHPEKVAAIISQNGNAYEEGLSKVWGPIRAYWKSPTAENRAALHGMEQPEAINWECAKGVPDLGKLSPDGYNIDQYFLQKDIQKDIQLDLFLDYVDTVDMYPRLHEYFRTSQPPLLAVWGENDPFFLPGGAQAFKRDIPRAEVVMFDAGHFALETHNDEIAARIVDFLGRTLK